MRAVWLHLFCGGMLLAGTAASPPAAVAETTDRPNVLFIAVDDLNDWIGCLGGHPQTLTPNLDRLAASSVLFTNAHCVAPACNPSRTAVFTGRSPHRSGLYDNRQAMREVLPDAEIAPRTFTRAGYRSLGAGKLLHYFIDAGSWDDYFPAAESENPLPPTLYPEKRPLSLPRAGPWQYVETDWGPLDADEATYGGDYLVAEWIAGQLRQPHETPFFLACGIYRPHEPWFVPRKYFEPFPLESIQLPPGYLEDDLEDLPEEGRRRGPNRYFAHIREQGQWRQAIQSYLASIHFADAMLAKVLTSLEEGPHAKNTIVVLWSDHGWHLGEKQHWQKYTGWRACTRVPLMIRVPPGVPGLPEGTRPGRRGQPVSLLSLSPTLLQLCGLPADANHDGPSLAPLLRDPHAEWPHVAATFLAEPGSYSLSGDRFRYIHYAGGGEELYDIDADPFEWRNLAGDAGSRATLERFRRLGPTEFAEKKPPSLAALGSLPWNPAGNEPIPASRPDGPAFDVVFLNEAAAEVKLWWVDRQGGFKPYASLPPGGERRQSTRPGAVWMISDAADRPLGYFRVGDRTAKAATPRDAIPDRR